jgi:hypothetical protein
MADSSRDEISIDGVRYVSVRQAAPEFGFVRDHVTHLARIGKIAGRKIGPTWYVAYPSLQQYVVVSEHERAVRWKELSELRRRERAAASSITTRDAPTDIVANARVSAPDMFPASRLPSPILPPPADQCQPCFEIEFFRLRAAALVPIPTGIGRRRPRIDRVQFH